MPCSSVVLKEEEEEEEEKAKPSSWKDAGYRLEKIFPVYAMGRFVRDVSTTADAVSISDDSDADPIWDAMRAEAKSEVTFFFFFWIWGIAVVVKSLILSSEKNWCEENVLEYDSEVETLMMIRESSLFLLILF